MSSALYPYKVRIDRFRPEPGRRLVVFSDVHGDLSSLRHALDAAQLRPDDILIPVGDYLERGPDSLGTQKNFATVSRAVSAMRCAEPSAQLSDDWADEIREDHAKRGGLFRKR